MRAEGYAAIPQLPPTVAEWEDLLVRIEIMPRALRATLDEGDEQSPAVRDTLHAMLAAEQKVGEWLETAAGAGESDPASSTSGRADTRSLLERFSAVRARNFAMVQRRGVNVWDWVGETATGQRVSVYQLLMTLVQSDGDALAEIRSSLQRRPAASEVSAC